jgi:hypothetical protein
MVDDHRDELYFFWTLLRPKSENEEHIILNKNGLNYLLTMNNGR